MIEIWKSFHTNVQGFSLRHSIAPEEGRVITKQNGIDNEPWRLQSHLTWERTMIHTLFHWRQNPYVSGC